jgi:hypothetical protein
MVVAGTITGARYEIGDDLGPCAHLTGFGCAFFLETNAPSSLVANDGNNVRAIGAAPGEVHFASSVPEPSSAFLMSTALIAVAFLGRTRFIQVLHKTC